jgi:outer membrane protein OmpA-like peptidoglycan-associated protein
MGKMKLKLAATTALAGLVVLAGCTNPDGTQNRTGTGALLGAATGAAAGQIIRGDTRGTLVGAAVGGALGGLVGNQLDAQARELQQSIGTAGAGVVNTGSELIVTLPEAVTFDFNSAAVRPSLLGPLAEVSRSLQNYPNTTIQVIGHTDNVGTAAVNQRLSEQRAAAVANVLISNGTPAWRIRTFGRGFNQPIASNATPEGRAQNRRVEIIITPTS